MKSKRKKKHIQKTKTERFDNPNDIWETPQAFFDSLHKIFNFQIDACASSSNKKCEKYFSFEENGLEQEWDDSTWCNPPYSRPNLQLWLEKASSEAKKYEKPICFLMFCRTETQHFQKYAPMASHILLIKGRLKFNEKTSSGSPKSPSLLLIFNGNKKRNLKSKLEKLGILLKVS